MSGHGRPSLSAFAHARVALIVCALWATSAVGQEAAPTAPIRLRISWGGGEASRWEGLLRLDRGSLTGLTPLNSDVDMAGSAWSENGQVRVGDLSPHKLDALELVAVDAGPNAKLIVQLSNRAGAPTQAEILLADVVRRPYQLRLDDRGNTLDVKAIADEVLRITANQSTLIYAPGEEFSFKLTPVMPESVLGTSLDIQTTLSPARGNEVLWSDSQRMSVPVNGHPSITLNVPLQVPVGVYTVRITTNRPSGFQRNFFPTKGAPIAERSFQVVVLSAQATGAEPAGGWENVLEIDPTSSRWAERLPSWTQFRRLPGLDRLPLGSMRSGAVDLPAGRVVELPATVAGADPHWQAYSLPLERTGVPHQLEIEYPTEAEQHFGVSIVEPNSAGVVEGIGRDAGVYVEGLGSGGPKGKQTYRLVFWPRSQAPLLLVTNQHPSAAAHFGRIRVLRKTSGRLSGEMPQPNNAERLVAAYFSRPLLAETFGATRGPQVADSNAAQRKSVCDWQTIYESGTRLADYTRYGGYNSAVVNVRCDAAVGDANGRHTFTPSSEAWRLPQQVGGVDGFELLLRILDREQLGLFPALAFSGPLVELEELRRASDPRTSGLEWVGRDGRTWLEAQGTSAGEAPYYNLLEPRVQQALLNLVRELIVRYGDHNALAGVVVQLSSDGYAQLPPLDWGLDDATVARFEAATGIRIAVAEGANRFAVRHAALTGQHAAAWRAWRNAQVTEFYRQLAGDVAGNGSQRRLVLATENVFAHPQVAARIRPDLLAANRVGAVLADLGIDRQSLERLPGVVVCPASFVAPMSPLADRAVELEINGATANWRRAAEPGAAAGALLFHPAGRMRLTSFEGRSSFPVVDDTGLVSESLASGAAVRKPYLQALVNNDPSLLLDGGELLPLGQEDVLRDIRQILQHLPTVATVSDVARQPVVVRTYATANATTLVAMNLSPWPASAQVTLEIPQAASMEPLIKAAGTTPADSVKLTQLVAGRQSWPVLLEPYGIHAVRISTASAKVAEVRVEANDAAMAELASKLSDLSNRDLTAPRLYQALANPNFEPVAGGGPLPRWRLAGGAADAVAELDSTGPQDGQTCLHIRNTGQKAAVESNAFATPATGQLAMTVFVRGQNLAPGSEVHLIVESATPGVPYYSSASVRTADIQRPDNGWGRPLAIFPPDLPSDGRSQLRIRFEIRGSGEVWFDNVKLYDLLFPLKFYPRSQAEISQLLILIHAAKKAQEDGRPSDCLQLLDGYWPRFLMAYTPPVSPVIATQPARAAALAPDSSTPPANEDQEPTPGISERLKRIMPNLLR